MEIKFKLTMLSDIVKDNVIPLLNDYKIVGFRAPLGGGKTTIIKEVLWQEGVLQPVTSPTFSYVNTYYIENKIFYHFDLYRMHDLQQLLAIGIEDFLEQKNAWCFIEWPDVVGDFFLKRPDFCLLELRYDKNNAMRVLILD